MDAREEEATALWAKIAALSLRERELLERLAALVGAGLAHVELHPGAYLNPSGCLLRALLEETSQTLIREVRGR